MTPRQLAIAAGARTRLQDAEARRADLRAGVLAACIVNPYRAKGAAPAKPSDFFASLAPPPQSDEQIYAVFRAWSLGHNARFAEA